MKYKIEDSCSKDTLMKLVQLYSEGDYYEYLYKRIVDDSENENDKEKHSREFLEWIKRPSYIECYNNYRIKKINDKSTEESLKKFLMKYKDYGSITHFFSGNYYNFYLLMKEYEKDTNLGTKVLEEMKRLKISPEEYNDIYYANSIETNLRRSYVS